MPVIDKLRLFQKQYYLTFNLKNNKEKRCKKFDCRREVTWKAHIERDNSKCPKIKTTLTPIFTLLSIQRAVLNSRTRCSCTSKWVFYYHVLCNVVSGYLFSNYTILSFTIFIGTHHRPRGTHTGIKDSKISMKLLDFGRILNLGTIIMYYDRDTRKRYDWDILNNWYFKNIF